MKRRERRVRDVAALALAVILAGSARAGDWESTVALGANLTDGNSKATTLNGSAVAARSIEQHEFRLGAEGNYGESETVTTRDGVESKETETTAQNAKGYVNYKRKFGDLYGYSDDSIFHDDLADLDYRLIAGAGAGRYLLQNDNTKLSVEGGGAYVREDFTSGATDDYFALRAAARHDQKLSGTSKLWESVEYLPDAADFGKYLFNAEAGVEAALNATLNVRLVVQDRYVSEVPEGRERNDVAVIGALVYKL